MLWVKYFGYKDGKLIRVSTGKETGTLNSNGYLVVRHQGKNYYAHRIIWEMGNGDIPDNMVIDHINGDRADNHFSNLRLCSFAQNAMNQTKKSNLSGLKGVVWDRGHNKWRAQIKVNYKNIYLGLYESKEAAYEAYKNAANKYHGEYCNYETT